LEDNIINLVIQIQQSCGHRVILDLKKGGQTLRYIHKISLKNNVLLDTNP